MSTRNRWTHRTGEGATIDVIGPPQPNAKYGLYLRIEDANGNYVGSVDGADLVRLAERLNRYLGRRRARGSRSPEGTEGER